MEEVVFSVCCFFCLSGIPNIRFGFHSSISDREVGFLMKASFVGNCLVLSSRSSEEKRKLANLFEKGYTHLCRKSKLEKHGTVEIRLSNSVIGWKPQIDVENSMA